eukprot:6459587-Amphidinium_carterae.1
MVQRDMVTFEEDVEVELGMFTVWKKSGRQRLIIDARRLNQMMRLPPKTRLASAGAVVEYQGNAKESLFFAAQDISDCYYQFRVPRCMVKFLAFPAVKASTVGVGQESGGQRVGSWGHDLSVLASTPNGTGMGPPLDAVRTQALADGREWLDRRPPPPPTSDEPALLVYVDNQLFVGTSQDSTVKARKTVHDCFEQCGLPMHEVQEGVRFIETLGMELDGLAKKASSSSSKRWRLKKAWEFLRRYPVLTGAQLEVLLGHLTHVMLLNRCTLAAFQSLLINAMCSYGGTILNDVPSGQPWCGLVNTSDASGVGYAVHEGRVPFAEIVKMGSWRDRWRFHKFHLPSSGDFRGMALHGTCLDRGLNLEREKGLIELSEMGGESLFSFQEICAQEGLQLQPNFPELDPTVLASTDWKLVQTRPYLRKESIYIYIYV